MKNLKQIATAFFLLTYFISCKSDDCVKEVAIPQTYSVGNGTYGYSDLIIEIPCDLEPSKDPINIVPPKLNNFNYQIIKFEYTIDPQNNITRLQFEVKLTNQNNFIAKGFPYFTIKTDNLQFSTNYSSSATSNCLQLEANGDCNFVLDITQSLDLGSWENPQLINVEYYLTEQSEIF